MDLARHLVVAAAVLCLVSPGEASDRFLWDQSDVVVPSSVGPLENVAVADDFIVPGVQEWFLIEAADVWMQDDMELPIDGILTGFDGTVGWAIYRQAFGEPSTLVASGVDTGALTMGPTIPACCWDTQLVRFRFDPPVRLGSGIYWLGIREGAWGQPADFTPVHASASARILGSSTRSAPVGAVPVAWNLGGGSDSRSQSTARRLPGRRRRSMRSPGPRRLPPQSRPPISYWRNPSLPRERRSLSATAMRLPTASSTTSKGHSAGVSTATRAELPARCFRAGPPRRRCR